MMSNTVKNIVLVFTLLCAIGLVVFCVELVMINGDNGNESESAASNGVGDNPGGSSNGNDNSQDGSDPSQNEQNCTSSGRPAGSTAGTRQNLPMPDAAELILYSDEELFDYVELDGEFWILTYLGDGDAALEIGFALIQPQDGIDGLARTYLGNYSDEVEAEVEGERSIGRSSIRGIYVSGSHGGTEYEAWLRDMTDFGKESIALVFAIRYQNEAQKEALFSIIDTMEFDRTGEPAVDDE